MEESSEWPVFDECENGYSSTAIAR